MEGRKFYCHSFVCLYLLKYLKVRKTEWQNYVHIFGDTKQRMEHIHKQIHYMFACSYFTQMHKIVMVFSVKDTWE